MSLHIFLKMPIAIIRKLVKKIANYALYIALAKTVGELRVIFLKMIRHLMKYADLVYKAN
jgi:hypothetical protein